MKRRTVLASLLLPALPIESGPAAAQDVYPSRPIQMIVPFPPGGVADITGRPVAHVMGRLLKQSVVVQNKPGAGGAVGAAQAARAAPDGHTILMALSSISVLPVADRLQGRPAAYELDQFAPIALISADPTVLVVSADGPYKTLKDFVEAAKAKPDKINYGSSGVYGTLHVAMEIFATAADIKLFHIPYQGGGPAVAALLGGQIDALASGPAAARRLASAATKVANAGASRYAIGVSTLAIASLNSGSSTVRFTASRSAAMTGAGVAAGAKSPDQM